MMKNAKKILFPAVAAASMVASGHSASLLTAFSPDGPLPIIDTAVTANQLIQLPVGGTIYQGLGGTAVGTINIKIIPAVMGQKGHCTFYLTDAFGASATAPAPAATIMSGNGCENVDLYFIQKGSPASTAYATIRINGNFNKIYYGSPIVPTTKLVFCTDASGSDTMTTTPMVMPPKQAANQPLDTIPGIVYLKNPDDYDQLALLIKGSSQKTTDPEVIRILNVIKASLVDKR